MNGSAHIPLFAEHVPHRQGAGVLDVKDLCVKYGAVTALENITFNLDNGERVAVVGPNGAGKSTLFRAITGILPASRGSINVFGAQPEKHFCIAYVVQRSQVDWTFPVSVYDVVMMGRAGEIGPLRRTRKADRERVNECLDKVGLADLRHRQISELSGGQQQRMFIARALAQEAKLMLMDEPFAGLDIKSQNSLLEIFDQLRTENVTVMVALHDLKLAAEKFDRVLLLNRTLSGFGTPKEIFDASHIMAVFGHHSHRIEADGKLILVHDDCCGGGTSDAV
jgi:manganese/iron transport system ATP-binding protein